MAESGFPSFVTTGWYGIVAPKGTSAEVIRLLNGEIASIVKTEDFQALLAQQGADPMGHRETQGLLLVGVGRAGAPCSRAWAAPGAFGSINPKGACQGAEIDITEPESHT